MRNLAQWRRSSLVEKLSRVARALNAPICGTSPAEGVSWALLAIFCCLLGAMFVVAHQESVFVAGDARFYMGIATGNYSIVMEPFASRQLGAIVAAGISHVLHRSIEQGFVLEGTLSVVVMLVGIYYLVLKTRAPRWLLFAIAMVPFWGLLLEDLVLPDLWYSALLVLLLGILAEDHMVLAALMMFPLMLARESTSLTLICFLAASWSWLRWRDRMIAVASAVLGSALVSHLASRAQPNMEELPQSIYMMAKVPWNFSNNVLGLVPWSNVNSEFCSVPRWTMQVHLGRVHAIGICGFSLVGWSKVTRVISSNFGLLPLLLCFVWWRSRKLPVQNVLLRFCLLYGIASLVLAPELGTWFNRLIGYSWPIFFVALPLLFDRVPANTSSARRSLAAIGFFGLHLLLYCLAGRWPWLIQLSVNATVWVCGFLLLRYWMPADRGRGDGPESNCSASGAISV